MIDAKELRLNNCVRYENENFKIHSVSPELPCLDTIEFGIGVVTYENIYPIELTEDILIKCGFKKRNYFNPTNIYCYKKGLYYIWSDGDFMTDIGDDETQITLAYNIHYLHQLQNLFYCLTGKELEITL